MSTEFEDEQNELRYLVRVQNRKKKSGGFQSMGLSNNVFRGVIRKGYKIPTPIQRKTIPVIMEGRDVVAMARTGSGKTAAFLIPMLERLQDHRPTGSRALILSPTRELALQTFKFAKEIGRYTKIKFTLILGGDKIENQFAAIHECPDVIIATPGRLIHILLEMNLKLNSVEYLVLDEADRLFEMGFQDQLQQIINRLAESRQTLLFSATLPKQLVDFASAGLNSPELVRLDVDTKLSENLKMVFLQCRSDDKFAVLLHLLNVVVKTNEQTVLFVATKHHVELLNMILTKEGHKCTYLYSSLDPTARKINTEKFRRGVANILIVTDIAARGIDVPLLDNAINFNFPAKPKLFLHRVGRVARAGRMGSAYSIVSQDEKALVLDLFLFLGRPLTYASTTEITAEHEYGLVPQVVVDSMEDRLRQIMNTTDIANMVKVVNNAYKKYIQSRPQPSAESIRRVKINGDMSIGFHSLFDKVECNIEFEKENLLKALKSYKPTNNKEKNLLKLPTFHMQNDKSISNNTSERSRSKNDVDLERSRSRNKVDIDNYIGYLAADHQTEKGLSIESGFEREASKICLDVDGDDEASKKLSKNRLIWDRKRKRFQNESSMKEKKMKLESGVKVAQSYQKNLYKNWLQNKNKDINDSDEEGGTNLKKNNPGYQGRRQKYSNSKSGKVNNGKGQDGNKGGRNKHKKKELKKLDQIVKSRAKKASVQSFQQQQINKKKKNTLATKIRQRKGQKH